MASTCLIRQQWANIVNPDVNTREINQQVERENVQARAEFRQRLAASEAPTIAVAMKH